ncbi:AAA family ATPase [Kineococcus sp. SYSU DK003]|uniref:AAA family ATPase n=1 Tax=Kineococcus sp. SYSU DK003 TaxID=3383124 RepID=UPI003D7CB4B0
MRVHRLLLENFRGVEHRELSLPDNGIVVLEGANEIGKSSMLEALDMVLTEKHSSRKAAVLAVKPVHRDAASVVEAEISSGPYRFTVRKQWHSRPATTLSVCAPRAEQLTGDEAHQRVRDILTETLDQHLWNALRMLQNASPDATALGGSSALAAALDAAAGSAEPDGDGAQDLYAAARERSAQFWTGTGRPTGRHRTCAEELAAAREAAGQARQALDLLADDTERHADLTRQRADVQSALEETAERAQALTDLVADLLARRDRLDAVREQAATAEQAAADARSALAARRREADDHARRTAALERDVTRIGALRPAVDEARARATAAATGAEELTAALDSAQESSDRAREALRRSQDRDALGKVRRRLAAVAAAAEEVRTAGAALAGLGVDATTVRRIEEADDTLRRLRARAEAVAARVVVDATAVEVVVDGTPVPAGTVAEHSATRPLTVGVAGFATVRVLPGADTGSLADDLDAAQAALHDLLTGAGVEDVATARAAHEERRAAQSALDLARGRLTHLTAEAGPAELQAEADRLLADLPGDDEHPLDLPAAREAEQVARESLQRIRSQARQGQAQASAAAREADRLAGELAALEAALQVARTEAATAARRLTEARATRDDADLERTAQEAQGAAERTRAEVAALEADLAARDADTVLVRARDVQAELTRLTDRRDALDAELVRLEARLSVMEGEARQEVWDEAESRVQRLAQEFESLARRAAAARLLHQTLEKHRDTQRRRYVSPFTDRLEELGRAVYGDTFRITLDDDLRITARTLQGRTVAYEQLSTGAREQLAVLLRLACATLVDPADGVPVVLDDALGHSDPARLQRLAAVFEHVAPTSQVLLLAPGPGVHGAIRGATVVRLDEAVSSAAAPAASASTG